VGKIRLSNISKRFSPHGRGGAELVAVDGVSLDISDQEIVCLVGPSGCGKTTLLNIVAGFEAPTSGEVTIGGTAVSAPGPDRIVVFQSPALFPWLTVVDNIAFAPRKRGVAPARCLEEATTFMRAVGLDGFGGHYPYQLSGGMRQRAQIASALVNHPDVLLMDEPFVALDFQTRLAMQELLLRIWQEFHSTILFITHDVEEALFLADRVYVMTKRPGRIKEEIAVPIAKPRPFDVVTTPPFVALKDRAMRAAYLRRCGRREEALTLRDFCT